MKLLNIICACGRHLSLSYGKRNLYEGTCKYEGIIYTAKLPVKRAKLSQVSADKER